MRAATALRTWRVHERAGLRVLATDGSYVRFRFGPFTVPCRIVYTVDEENRRGFAYGTLPGHPEKGEELFLLTLTAAGEVRAEIRAFSRPATRVARLGGPLTRLTQQAITARYLSALRTFAA